MCMETINENFYFELSSLQLYDCNFSEGLKCNGLKLSYRDSVLNFSPASIRFLESAFLVTVLI